MPRDARLMLSDHLGSAVGIDPTSDMTSTWDLRFAPKRRRGSLGSAHWCGIAGTSFWIDPTERQFAILLIQAPGQRRHYRHLFRALEPDQFR